MQTDAVTPIAAALDFDDTLIESIRSSVIGRHDLVSGPFGPRPVVYADYTASGRSLDFIEHYISEAVLPLYANTHTESSGTGAQTTHFREEARRIIARSVGATDEHAVLFCGSGATYAIAKMIGVLGLRIPAALDDHYRLSDHIEPADRPVVFIGPFEHHSNELPWRESIADVVTINEDSDGHVSLEHLEEELRRYENRPLKIGSFSAASNVTGIITETAAVSALLHRHDALAFWDFAAAAPYVAIDMGSAANRDGAYFDAIFVSPHKFVGGPGTPGVLVARRELFINRVPDVPAGGTVAYVNPSEHDYLADIEHREEGGTPEIVGSIRAGLAFQLKDAVGTDQIGRRETDFVTQAISSWDKNPNIDVLGSHQAKRLSIISFVVRHDQQHLHHNYVVALLNDLFGIQARGGCSCAGPYGHRLLGIDVDQSQAFQQEISRGCEGIKPGWVRLSFNYCIDDETFRYILDAVHLIASAGSNLLPYYSFEPTTGIWRHRQGGAEPPMSLSDISYESGQMRFENRRHVVQNRDLRSYLDQACTLCVEAQDKAPVPLEPPPTTAAFEAVRWFPYPNERRST